MSGIVEALEVIGKMTKEELISMTGKSKLVILTNEEIPDWIYEKYPYIKADYDEKTGLVTYQKTPAESK